MIVIKKHLIKETSMSILFIMGALTLGLIFLPKIPLLNQLPYRIPIHRAIWRSYYQSEGISRKRKQ